MVEHVKEHGHAWRGIADRLKRTSKQVRERYLNVLSPDIIRTPWTPEELEALFSAQKQLGTLHATHTHTHTRTLCSPRPP